MNLQKSLIVCAIVLLQSSCGGNFFEDLSTTDTDAAKYEDALKAIDAIDYTSAIASLTSMSTAGKTQTKVIQTWAGALAGQCGQDFVSLITGLGSSSGAPLLFFMQAFTAVAVTPASCALAQKKIEELGVSSARTSDQNLFMFVLGISKLGTYLKSNADLLPATGVGGDGTTDPTFSACANQPAPGSPMLTDADLNQIITGLGLIFDNIAAVGASIAGSGAVTGLDGIKAACELATGIVDCAVTDPADPAITAGARLFFRELIQTSDFGVGSTCVVTDIGIPDGLGGTVCCP